MSSLITINLVVHNGEKYLRHCLDSLKKQSLEGIQVNIFDNCSTDKTREIAKKEAKKWELENKSLFIIESKLNLGMWPAQEETLSYTRGKYVVCLSVDVILDVNFCRNAVEVMEKDERIGGLEAKIYQWHFNKMGFPELENIIDTTGFKIFKSRRIINEGQGEIDNGQFENEKEIFGVEGAVPVFRKKALESCKINGKIIDPYMFWYGDDLDLAWRMRLFGWRQIYAPNVIAFHDRSTTKSLKKSLFDFIRIRKTIPIKKRRLEWRNTILTLVKNDYLINLIKNAPKIFWRQMGLWGYFTIFEPSMYFEIISIARLLPRMLKMRSSIMKKAKIPPDKIRGWFE